VEEGRGPEAEQHHASPRQQRDTPRKTRTVRRWFVIWACNATHTGMIRIEERSLHRPGRVEQVVTDPGSRLRSLRHTRV
jgi:hypothetical protein